MAPASNKPDTELTALMISPNRELARQFSLTLANAHSFQVLGELKSYPTQQILEMRMRQLQPDVVLLDLSTDLDRACDLIRFLAGSTPAPHVVGLHVTNDSEAILRSLRVGATEFLCAPFDPDTQQQAVGRIQRLRQPEPAAEKELGRVILFSNAKPGSGASTLAVHTAFALRRLSNKRVLVADFDLVSGSISFYLRIRPNGSLLDVLGQEERSLASMWPSLVTHANGLDVLAGPETPSIDAVDPGRVHDLLEYTRRLYGWIVLDLPSIFQRISLLALSESDCAFVVSTSELPSLHLARKATGLLAHLGLGSERFQMLVNRMGRREGLGASDIEKIFNCPVHTTFPNDYFSIDRVVTLGQPLEADSELGRSIEEFAGRLAGVRPGDRNRNAVLLSASPAFSQG